MDVMTTSKITQDIRLVRLRWTSRLRFFTFTLEYLDKKGLADFLYNREKTTNGILQKFVEPKGSSNVLIRGIWSPKVLLLERRENRRKLLDKKHSMYERAVTYEVSSYSCNVSTNGV